MPKCVTLFHNTRRRRERGFWRPIAPNDHIFSRPSVSTGWAAFGLLPRPLCFFTDSIVETSSNWMAEDFSRSRLSTAGGHGRSRKYLHKPLRQVCNVAGSHSLPLLSFAVCLISRNKCLRSWSASCFEITSRLICLPCFSSNQYCKRRTDVLVRFFSVSWNHIVLKRDQFVTCIGYNGLVFQNGYLTFFSIDTYSIFFRDACLFSSARTVVWLSSLVFAILFFSTMHPLVLLCRRGFLKFSNDLNFNSKFGRHSFSVNLFISKVIFFVTWVAFCFQDSNNFCSRPTSAILYSFMHKCNSTLNAFSSIANQTASSPFAMWF